MRIFRWLVVILIPIAIGVAAGYAMTDEPASGNPDRLHRTVPAAQVTPVPDCAFNDAGQPLTVPCAVQRAQETPCPPAAPDAVVEQTSDDFGETWQSWGCPKSP